MAGLKVLDFMWALAGPGGSRTLADFGATVVRVESQSRPDVLRAVNPFRGPEGDQEGSFQWHSLNAGKYGLSLDLNTAPAREVVFDLVRWADVVTESFSPGAMAAWGFDEASLRAVNPEVIFFSSSLMGQSGPLRNYAGFGTMAAAIAGFYPVTGWPDRIPAGPFTAFTDYISPRFTVAAVLAAVDWRRRTGRGMRLDLAQLEGSLHLLGRALWVDEVTGTSAVRHGNEDPTMAPHNVYAGAGDDRWLAVACETDAQWRNLAGVIGLTELASLTASERLARRAELDDAIAAWARERDPARAQVELQAVGVPAHAVLDSAGCVTDPQFVHRRMFPEVPHASYGTTWVEGCPFTLSRTGWEVRWGGPTFNQHLEDVLGGMLGYDGEHIAELIIAGALE